MGFEQGPIRYKRGWEYGLDPALVGLKEGKGVESC